MSDDPQAVLDYWLGQVGPKGWYAGGDALDAEIRGMFADLWQAAAVGGLDHWVHGTASTLAFIVLTDQLPRNMWRGEGRAFATDTRARAAAITAIDAGWDMGAPEPERQFFYLPLMHSEDIADQDRCVALFESRMRETGAPNLLQARAHHEVIRRFDRFPYRNKALGREITPEEAEFLENGSYGAVLREFQG